MDYIPGAESETGSESVITRIGVPLAGPVNVSGQEIYRYSADYTEPAFPPKVRYSLLLLIYVIEKKNKLLKRSY